jgi:hypothetical protein
MEEGEMDMDSNHENTTVAGSPTCIDPDYELRTIPTGWDLSELLASAPAEKIRLAGQAPEKDASVAHG